VSNLRHFFFYISAELLHFPVSTNQVQLIGGISFYLIVSWFCNSRLCWCF